MDLFSGVRPSSGAETLEKDATCEISDSLEHAEVAAAEDGRTPLNTYRSIARFSRTELERTAQAKFFF